MTHVVFTGPIPPQPPDIITGPSIGEGLSAISESLLERRKREREELVRQEQTRVSQFGLDVQAGVSPFQEDQAAGGPVVGQGREAFDQSGTQKQKFLSALRTSGIQPSPELQPLITQILEGLQGAPEPGPIVQLDPTKEAVQQVGDELVTLREPELSREQDAATAAAEFLGPGASDDDIAKAAQILIAGGGGGVSQGRLLLESLGDPTLSETSKEIERLIGRGFSEADASDIARGRVKAIQHPTDGTTILLNTVTGETRETEVKFDLLPPAAAPTPGAPRAVTVPQAPAGQVMTSFEAISFASASGFLQDLLQRVGGKGSISDVLDVINVLPDIPQDATRAITALADLRLAVLAAYRIPDARVKMTFEAVDDLVPKAGILRSEDASRDKLTSLHRRVLRDRGLAAAEANNPNTTIGSRVASAEQVRQLDRLLGIIGSPEAAAKPEPGQPEPEAELSPEAQTIFDKHTRGFEIDAEDIATLGALSPTDKAALAKKMGLELELQ